MITAKQLLFMMALTGLLTSVTMYSLSSAALSLEVRANQVLAECGRPGRCELILTAQEKQ